MSGLFKEELGGHYFDDDEGVEMLGRNWLQIRIKKPPRGSYEGRGGDDIVALSGFAKFVKEIRLQDTADPTGMTDAPAPTGLIYGWAFIA
ncbi:hypothetical protein Trydic_g3909 [Trypoxylus dichotomus]